MSPSSNLKTDNIVFVHEQHHSGAMDAAEPVAIRIDRRVELALAAEGRELKNIAPARIDLDVGRQVLRRDEIGLAGFGLPFAMAGRRAAGGIRPAATSAC